MAGAVEGAAANAPRTAVVFGALGQPDPRLASLTVATGMRDGKFANLNRLAEEARPLAADWILLLDDDIDLPRKFTDRMICVAERLGLDLAQPALSRASHGAWT